jgi:hypothetical protein
MAEDEITGQGDERLPYKWEAQRVPAISDLSFECDHYSSEKKNRVRGAAMENSGIR